MVQPTQLKDVSIQAVRKTQETLRDIPRVVISAEEKVRQRVQAILRVTLATLFFLISGLISLGANVTIALAKKVTPEQSHRARRSKALNRHKMRFSHIGKLIEKHAIASAHHHSGTTGTASWYGGQFQNRRTASGARFNTHSYMAAHRTLPFGTLVKVTNLANGKDCIVQITDRGPYVGSRIIDVSKAAAGKLGFLSTGTAKVRLEVVSSPTDYASNLHTQEDVDASNDPSFGPEQDETESVTAPQSQFEPHVSFPARLAADLPGHPEVYDLQER